MLTQIITYISNISWQQRRSKKRKTMPHSSSWTQNAAGDTKILKVESPEISPTSARNNRRQDEGSSWGKSLKLLNITPRLFEERSILSFVGSHQWTSPSFKASESSFSPPPRSHRPSDERPIEVDSTAGINKAAADSLISLEPIFLMYCILNIWSDIHIDAVRIDLVALRLKGGRPADRQRRPKNTSAVILLLQWRLKLSIQININKLSPRQGMEAEAALVLVVLVVVGGWLSSLLRGRRYSLEMCFISREQEMTAGLQSRSEQSMLTGWKKTRLDVRRNTSN